MNGNDFTLSGLQICVTGKLQHFTRNSVEAYIHSKGGVMTKSVTYGVNYLVTNTPNSGTKKNRDAMAYGIRVITEDQFIMMAETGQRVW